MSDNTPERPVGTAVPSSWREQKCCCTCGHCTEDIIRNCYCHADDTYPPPPPEGVSFTPGICDWNQAHAVPRSGVCDSYIPLEDGIDWLCPVCNDFWDDAPGKPYCAAHHGYCEVCKRPRPACSCVKPLAVFDTAGDSDVD